jgi:hypothetical protein
MDMEGEILFNDALGAILEALSDAKEDLRIIKDTLRAQLELPPAPREIRAVVEADKRAKREKIKRIADTYEVDLLFDSLENVSHEVGTPICRKVGKLTDRALLERAAKRRKRIADA